MAKKRPTKKKTSATAKRKPSTAQLAKLDREILELANRRADLTAQREATASERIGVEEAELESIVNQNQGPLNDAAVRSTFRELISGCAATARQQRVAFLGPEFTYSHLAAIEKFGQAAELVPVNSIAAVFEEVDSGHVEFRHRAD